MTKLFKNVSSLGRYIYCIVCVNIRNSFYLLLIVIVLPKLNKHCINLFVLKWQLKIQRTGNWSQIKHNLLQWEMNILIASRWLWFLICKSFFRLTYVTNTLRTLIKYLFQKYLCFFSTVFDRHREQVNQKVYGGNIVQLRKTSHSKCRYYYPLVLWILSTIINSITRFFKRIIL